LKDVGVTLLLAPYSLKLTAIDAGSAWAAPAAIRAINNAFSFG
jgi:hypothetical protein